MGCCEAKREIRQTRAAMCLGCPKQRGEVCRVDGESCAGHVHAGACPRGRYPNDDGEVRWVGLTWNGVPAPIRWELERRHGWARRPLAGCGCLVALRRYWIDDGAGNGEPSGRWDLGAIARAWLRSLA